MTTFEKRNSFLGIDFDRYVREHPEFAERIPQHAPVIHLLTTATHRLRDDQEARACPFAH